MATVAEVKVSHKSMNHKRKALECPLHGQRFIREHFHVFVAAWRWKNEVNCRWPKLSGQFHKEWKRYRSKSVIPEDLGMS